MIKKSFKILALSSILALFSTAFTNEKANLELNKTSSNTQSTQGKTLVVYFSHRGHTKTVAQWISSEINADIFEILAENPYPATYEETLPIAKTEKNENTRPKIANSIENFSEYDTIFVGYPLWFEKMPMILFTFFEEYDFSNKTIIPFVTYGGSPIARGWNEISKLEPNAKIGNKLAVRTKSVDKSEKAVRKFAKKAVSQ